MAVSSEVWSPTAELIQISFFFLHNFIVRKHLLFLDLSNLSIWFFFPLLSKELSSFHLKEKLYISELPASLLLHFGAIIK